MPTIRFEPDKKDIIAGESETILSSSLRAGISHAHACGGNARCSTCRILVEQGLDRCVPRSEPERALSERLHFSSEVRLACQTTVSGDITARRLVLDEEDVVLTQRILENPGSTSIGEEKELAILFADIRGFTPLSERLPPYDVIYILNLYFDHMGKVISAHGGHIDNYMGDGLIALFGLDDMPDASFRAVSAGLGMLSETARLRLRFEALYATDFRIGVGIHYGEVVAGTIGAAGRQRMTVIGDAVNFASRIETANRSYDTELLISGDTYRDIAERVIIGRRIEQAIIKGKSGHHMLYEVIGLKKEPHESAG